MARRRGPRRVLLASPVDERRCALARELEQAGYRVKLASTGAEAAALLAEADRPEIAILDWSLRAPGVVALCRQLRDQARDDEYLYILVILPLRDRGEVPAALRAGADDVVTAPVMPAELQGRLAAGARLLDMADRLRASRREMALALAQLQAVQAATEADLAEARRLQQGLMGPRNARFGSFDFALLLRPSGHVGGDLVGLFPINARRVALYAIDVCGSGVAAALLTARLAAYLSVNAVENLVLYLDENDLYEARRPSEVAAQFNRVILDEVGREMYFTMVYADLDLQTGAGRLVQAGHPHPIIQRQDGSLQILGEGGLPIGLLEDASWEEISFQLEPGARLFVSSDGITEAMSPSGTLLGEDGLLAILQTNAFLGGNPLLESLCWSVAQFTQGNRTDDISAILVERDPPGGKDMH